MIEVLIALIIFSTGLLALATMQISSLRWIKQAEIISLKTSKNSMVKEGEYKGL